MLEIKNLSKIYTEQKQPVEAIKDLSLSINEGEFVAIVGQSGCGKTTLLKMIAGLISPSGGEIILDGEKVSKPGKDRGMVFQSFTLFPWLNVKDNIGFGLSLQGIKDKEKEKIVNHYLEMTGLKDFANSYPKNLSGGMQQRVAIARTLANNPKVLLMDEPFGSLDAQTRSQMQEFLTSIWEKEHKTILFITHDVGEAVFLANTVYVLSSRPTKIKNSHQIPFDRPRTHELKHQDEFFKLELLISKELEN